MEVFPYVRLEQENLEQIDVKGHKTTDISLWTSLYISLNRSYLCFIGDINNIMYINLKKFVPQISFNLKHQQFGIKLINLISIHP